MEALRGACFEIKLFFFGWGLKQKNLLFDSQGQHVLRLSFYIFLASSLGFSESPSLMFLTFRYGLSCNPDMWYLHFESKELPVNRGCKSTFWLQMKQLDAWHK